MIWLTRAMVAGTVALAVYGILTAPALPHEWYPDDCCSGTDCKPVPDSRFARLENGGWRVDGKWDFPPVNISAPKTGETRFSESGRYHTCEPIEGDRPKCVFVPPDGM